MTIQVKKLILAPMEGVIDQLMRNTLTSINQYDLCITEFLRVVNVLEPKHMFYRICPELKDGSKTANGTPIRVQLLGQDPVCLADNAARAIELGSNGVDINFGCPAKAVNKSKGGAVLLDDPELIYQILTTIKNTIGKDNVLSAKIRLGFNDTENFNDVVNAVKSSNTNMLTIHARTKKHGYKPPAYWDYIGSLPKDNKLDIIANGEIWSVKNAQNCMETSKTDMLMIGRGALAVPNLANMIRHNEDKLSHASLKSLLLSYSHAENSNSHYYYSSRLKQWLRYLRLQYPQAAELFDEIKRMSCKNAIIQCIEQSKELTAR